jgi:cytochrome c-type biogenesis protein CcmH/NrfF
MKLQIIQLGETHETANVRILMHLGIYESAENPEISEIGRKMRCNQCRNETIATIAGMAGMAGMADFLGKIKGGGI